MSKQRVPFTGTIFTHPERRQLGRQEANFSAQPQAFASMLVTQRHEHDEPPVGIDYDLHLRDGRVVRCQREPSLDSYTLGVGWTLYSALGWGGRGDNDWSESTFRFVMVKVPATSGSHNVSKMEVFFMEAPDTIAINAA
ncbi:MAG: hypothetical protein ABIA47_01730 [bacterium]